MRTRRGFGRRGEGRPRRAQRASAGRRGRGGAARRRARGAGAGGRRLGDEDDGYVVAGGEGLEGVLDGRHRGLCARSRVSLLHYGPSFGSRPRGVAAAARDPVRRSSRGGHVGSRGAGGSLGETTRKFAFFLTSTSPVPSQQENPSPCPGTARRAGWSGATDTAAPGTAAHPPRRCVGLRAQSPAPSGHQASQKDDTHGGCGT